MLDGWPSFDVDNGGALGRSAKEVARYRSWERRSGWAGFERDTGVANEVMTSRCAAVPQSPP